MALKRRDGKAVVAQPIVEKEKTLTKKEKKLLKKQQKEAEKAKGYTYSAYEHLKACKPTERYVFHSDYFEIDDQVATVLSFFHADGSQDNFGPFWGINRIPSGLLDGVTTVTLEQISRMSDGWIQSHQSKAEGIAAMDSNETSRSGTSTSKHQAGRKVGDLDTVARELQDGCSYLNVHYRLLVKAKDLEQLDYALDTIKRLYVDRFGTLSTAAYAGDERAELSNLFASNEKKIGRGFYYTSSEFAGSYSLVTHGLEDPGGEYVGYMVGDVNNSAVLFDVDNYKHHSVIVNENYHERLGRVHISDMWASKVSQSALLNNHKVVHIVMNGANLDDLGPKFSTLTYKLDMHAGAVNMFEMFGSIEDELSVYSSQMKKLVLMAEQAYETTEADRSIIRGSLEEIATEFYIDRRMWYENAKINRDKLRVVGIPHNEVPRLQEFVSYLDTAYKEQLSSSARDEARIHAFDALRLIFKNMLSSNGDLFNSFTSGAIDGATTGQRVIYDFGDLMRRGRSIAMAQLVNIFAFAVGNLGEGDVLIIHGSNSIDDDVKEYLDDQLAHLFAKGGRVVYSYDETDKMLEDKGFCHFDKSDYTIFGNMTDTAVVEYQKLLGQDIPADLARLVTNKSENICYIRRGFDNVVFKQDLALGLELPDVQSELDAQQKPKRKRKRFSSRVK